MMRYILLAFVFYILYKLIFDFVIPVSRATSRVRSQIKEMQNMQEQQFRQQQEHTHTQSSATHTTSSSSASQNRPASSGKEGDYIEFEEIK
ncbi:DUF4834 family protein [Filimonas effusa]|uniref:DUF4834 family protein n=1 Tax=Filimonas effusa TaxID=2508721 RepID=A0A4Q1D573_9BACT|nr:DUF4834 family protein [Filimonas effusa]RXK83589.1 DUF4834 family protein [Filimonas effusa]